jgi:hypothetical protein
VKFLIGIESSLQMGTKLPSSSTWYPTSHLSKEDWAMWPHLYRLLLQDVWPLGSFRFQIQYFYKLISVSFLPVITSIASKLSNFPQTPLLYITENICLWMMPSSWVTLLLWLLPLLWFLLLKICMPSLFNLHQFIPLKLQKTKGISPKTLSVFQNRSFHPFRYHNCAKK